MAIDRRSILAISLAPLAAAVPFAEATASAIKPVRRVSMEKSDPGAAIYERLRGHGKDVTILLNGVKQDSVVTADADRGYIKRYASSSRIEKGDWPVEELTGVVEIRIIERRG